MGPRADRRRTWTARAEPGGPASSPFTATGPRPTAERAAISSTTSPSGIPAAAAEQPGATKEITVPSTATFAAGAGSGRNAQSRPNWRVAVEADFPSRKHYALAWRAYGVRGFPTNGDA